jgi:hypothetical protein
MKDTSQQSVAAESLVITGQQSDIIKCLLYFDIFNYPLTKFEIFENCSSKNCSLSDVERNLQDMVEEGVLFQTEGFYHLSDRSSIVEHRLKVNGIAARFWPKAYSMSAFISRFPFVEGVFITGSLAKNCMNEDSDIDYLVITRPGRLWLCRALLTTYKKIFLLNRRKYFCVNYYLSSDSLAIPDENLFTATEIMSAVPIYNASTCKKFFAHNLWVSGYYPNKPSPDFTRSHALNNSLPKRETKIRAHGSRNV